MKRAMMTISAAAMFLSMGFMSILGFSDASAQSLNNDYQVTGDEFGHEQPQGFSESQFNLLWNSYNSKSDSLLGRFFNNWKIETQNVEEPLLESPVSYATSSLFYFLLNTDYQSPSYPYDYAVIQNQIEATASSSFSDSQIQYVLQNYHPQSSDPNLPVFVMLDDSHNELIQDFLGDWSEVKAMAAQQFFGNYVPFGVDVNYSNNQNSWALFRHWYTFSFSSDLQEADVLDQTPSGNVEYTCVVGQDGIWEKIQDGAAESVQPPESPLEPEPYPVRPPHASPPVTIIVTPSSSPAPSPKPSRHAHPGSKGSRPTSPKNPSQKGRPRQDMPPGSNPPSPKVPTQPPRPRATPPAPQGRTTPQTPVQRPRQYQPKVSSSPPPPKSAPPNKKTDDQKNGRPRSK